MLSLILLIIGVILLRSIYYGCYWYLAKHYEDIYLHWVHNNNATKLRQAVPQIKRVIEVSGVEPKILPVVQEMGYGQLASMSVQPLSNMLNRREDIVQSITSIFGEAIGSLRHKTIESFTPIYWIEFIIYLPTKLLKFLGLSTSNLPVKLLQIIWWVIAAISTLAGIFFNKEFMEWVKSLRN